MKHILLSLLGVAALTAMVWADPPGRVGRLSYVDGSVSFAPAVGETWQTATANYPLTTGNQLSTGAGARAEVQMGLSAIRIGSDSEITFETLDDQTVQIRLDKGLMSVRLRHPGPDRSFQVDLQTATVALAAPGSYRLDQADSGDATVITRDGDAQVTGGQAAFHVYSDQAATIPSSGPGAYTISRAPERDAWDAWVADRDVAQEDVASTRYVSSEMNGAGDLDAWGHWIIVAGYGPVWIPQAVPAGWAPYTFGHWVWFEPWGWTLVDDEPWGFAPFHYGRWILYTGVWCWAPGPIIAHPVFAPALVRWVGGVPAPGVPPAQAHISWVPLQPRQEFRPLYPVSTTYLRAVNGSVVYRSRFPARPGFVVGPAGVMRRPGYAMPAPVHPGRPYYVPLRGRQWVGAPAYAGRPVYAGRPDSAPAHVYRGRPAYVGTPEVHGRPSPPTGGHGVQDPWLLRRGR